MRNRFVKLVAVALVALTFGATKAQADTSLNDLVFGNLGQPGNVPVYLNPQTPIIIEDDLGTSVVREYINGEENTIAQSEFGYILGVIDFQAIRRGDGELGDIRTIGKAIPSASIQGADTSLTALVFGEIVQTEGGFALVPVNGARTVVTSAGEVIDIPAFSANTLVQVYFEQGTDILALQSAAADVANVLTGNLVAEFGFTGEGNEFYDLSVSGSGIDGYELSLNLIFNNTGLAIGKNNLGTDLYGVKELEDGSSNSKWDVVDDGDFKIVVVPTPAALPAGLALVGLVAARRRRSA